MKKSFDTAGQVGWVIAGSCAGTIVVALPRRTPIALYKYAEIEKCLSTQEQKFYREKLDNVLKRSKWMKIMNQGHLYLSPLVILSNDMLKILLLDKTAMMRRTINVCTIHLQPSNLLSRKIKKQNCLNCLINRSYRFSSRDCNYAFFYCKHQLYNPKNESSNGLRTENWQGNTEMHDGQFINNNAPPAIPWKH